MSSTSCDDLEAMAFRRIITVLRHHVETTSPAPFRYTATDFIQTNRPYEIDYSGFESIVHPQSRGPPPEQPSGPVWFCCKCNQGAFSVANNTHCPHCHVQRCANCKIKSGTRP